MVDYLRYSFQTENVIKKAYQKNHPHRRICFSSIKSLAGSFDFWHTAKYIFIGQECPYCREESILVTQEKKKKILVMDDEDMVGEIACQMLGYLGFETMRVIDGADAVREYKENREKGVPFSAVIVDLTVPGGMGGKEAAAEILKIDGGAKVFVSSGYSTDPIMVNFQDYGFTGGIAKPFDLAAMEKMLSSIS